MAGLTALYALEHGRSLLDQSVLITGATGGVGYFACQLAHEAGARVTAVVRRPDQVEMVRSAGADHVVVTDDASAAYGPFDRILDSVGGRTLGNVLAMAAPGGACVAFGASEGAEVTFNVSRFYATGGSRSTGSSCYTSRSASRSLRAWRAWPAGERWPAPPVDRRGGAVGHGSRRGAATGESAIRRQGCIACGLPDRVVQQVCFLRRTCSCLG